MLSSEPTVVDTVRRGQSEWEFEIHFLPHNAELRITEVPLWETSVSAPQWTCNADLSPKPAFPVVQIRGSPLGCTPQPPSMEQILEFLVCSGKA